jgi:hypothetical protein
MSPSVVVTGALCALFVSPVFGQSTTGSGPGSPSRPGGVPGSPGLPGTSGQPGAPALPGTSGAPSTVPRPIPSTTPRDPAIPRPGDPASTLRSLGDTEGRQSGGNPSQTAVDSQISRIQEALKSQGHDPGPIDGRLGARTQDAIRAFQSSRGLPVTGQMDQQTMERLGVRRPIVR